MKKGIGILALALIAIAAMTSLTKSDSGIEFDHLTMEKAQKKAAKSEKLIFIDAYTDWCGPCKRMAATTFKDSEVAEFFNDEFINLKIEMEKNPEGNSIARKYGVRAYPTLLIIDSDGNLVKKTIGFKTKDQLMAFAGSAL
ncbi:MAG: thioredoxin domain-containing protein [Crocinitomicaceae bacterium]|jgi:thioredoxin 1|nr:thioredoxin domain-containing protein [Crocinitomicaceae bacterium]